MNQPRIGADPNGAGYYFNLFEERKGDPPKVDLNTLTIQGMADGTPVGEPTSIAYGRGIITLKKIEVPGWQQDYWMTRISFDQLPSGSGLDSISVRYMASVPGSTSNWKEFERVERVIIPERKMLTPKDEPGQRFIILPGNHQISLKGLNGEDVSMDDLVLTPLELLGRLKDPDGTIHYRFQVFGRTGDVFLSTNQNLLKIKELEPIVDDQLSASSHSINDNMISALKSRWEGGFEIHGGSAYIRGANAEYGHNVDVRGQRQYLQGVYRLWRTRSVNYRHAVPEVSEIENCEMLAIHPLLIVLKSGNSHAILEEAAFQRISSKAASQANKLSGTARVAAVHRYWRQEANKVSKVEPLIPKVSPFFFVGDPWQLDRFLTKRELIKDFKDFPRSWYHDPKGEGIKIGMTPQEVLWRLGCPDELKTINQLLATKNADWHYDFLAPYSHIVTFEKGKVIRTHSGRGA